jgi:single-strand DNA-binding protein
MIIVQIAGHLGSDPETRFTPSNQKVTSFRVATNIKRGGKEKTVWWKVTVWGDRFDKRIAYLKKGSAVFVMGEMGIPEIYTDKEGNPQTSFEVIAEYITFNPYGGGKSDKPAQAQEVGEEMSSQVSSTTSRNMGPVPGSSSANFADDDIPF